MASNNICRVPIGAFSVLAVFLNITMVIFVLKEKGTKRGFHVILVYIGLVNAITALPMSAFSFVGQNIMDEDVRDKTVAKTILISVLFLQLHVNLALTYDRYLAVTEPLQYRSVLLMRKSKKHLIIGPVCILTISCIIAYLRANQIYLTLPKVAVGCGRFVTFLSITFIHYKLLRAYKKSQAITQSFNATSSVQTAAHEVRAMNERHMTYKCIGITLSYVILNLPLAIVSNVVSETKGCNTSSDVIFSICLSLDAFNRTTDPIWFFLMDRRRRLQNRRVQAIQNNTSNVTRGGTNN